MNDDEIVKCFKIQKKKIARFPLKFIRGSTGYIIAR